jgi:hypothetical protein
MQWIDETIESSDEQKKSRALKVWKKIHEHKWRRKGELGLVYAFRKQNYFGVHREERLAFGGT